MPSQTTNALILLHLLNVGGKCSDTAAVLRGYSSSVLGVCSQEYSVDHVMLGDRALASSTQHKYLTVWVGYLP